jgi:hypothetical protein
MCITELIDGFPTTRAVGNSVEGGNCPPPLDFDGNIIKSSDFKGSYNLPLSPNFGRYRGKFFSFQRKVSSEFEINWKGGFCII